MIPNIIIIPPNIKSKLLYSSPGIKTPFRDNVKIIFADVTASGRPSPIIEEYINTHILPYYSNTHSNAYCGIMMKNLIMDTKDYIRKTFNIDQTKQIIFTGCGATCAINHLIHCLQLESHKKVNIFITPMEHHSNYLPWVELSQKYKNIFLHVIPINDNFDIDVNFLEIKLKETSAFTINIITMTACSNVLGIKIDFENIYRIIQKYNGDNCCYGKRNLLFIDYACSAPYVEIRADICDALFISPHKFIGGISTPGLLIANKKLFYNTHPFIPGGGCVKSVCKNKIEYELDIEKRETAGTPNIIGIIKIKKILEVKNFFLNTIQQNEYEITKYVFGQFKKMQEENNNLIIILPDCHIDNRLPIICIAIKNLHHNLIVALLSDLFGIQTRGGVSCTGLLVELLQNKYNINGWCRISFNWIMDQTEIDYVITAVKYILYNYNTYLDLYTYDPDSNLFAYKSEI